MIPYEVDPSLHHEQPVERVLDDGFSPPAATQPLPPSDAGVQPPPDPQGGKSAF